MNKTTLFAAVFTAATLYSILSMLVKLSAAVESATASLPSVIG